MTTFNYDLDIAWDTNFKIIAELLEEFNATLSVIEAIGPGGGNPYVNFQFKTESDMNDFIEYWEDGECEEIQTVIKV